VNAEQAAAFIYSQTVCALAEIEAMKIANVERAMDNYSPAYDEDAFRAIPEKYGIGHNATIRMLLEAAP
jgi:hypothetical protein